MPILIKFPTRCPKGLDRSVYSHLVCSISGITSEKGGTRGVTGMEGAATVSIETADVYAGVQSCVRRYLSRYWNFFLSPFSISFFYF